MVCLDSDILIDFLNNKKYAIEKLDYYFNNNIEISTTTINVFEIVKGFLKLKKNPELFHKFLSKIDILGFDFVSSKKAAEIFENLRLKGDLIEIPDILIASIAIINNEPLLTNNIAHFKRISDIKLEN